MAQGSKTPSKPSGAWEYEWLYADSVLAMPQGCGSPAMTPLRSAIYRDTCNQVTYIFDKHTGSWYPLSDGTTGVFLPISDTNAMLSAYVRALVAIKRTDTAAMLAPYAKLFQVITSAQLTAILAGYTLVDGSNATPGSNWSINITGMATLSQADYVLQMTTPAIPVAGKVSVFVDSVGALAYRTSSGAVVEFASIGAGPAVINQKDSVQHGGLYVDSAKALVSASSTLYVGDTIHLNDMAFFYGNSTTAGIGASDTTLRMTSLYCYNTRTAERNYGQGGTTLVKYAPGDSSLSDRIKSFQPYRGQYLFLDYGINDAQLHPGSYAVFIAAYGHIIDTTLSAFNFSLAPKKIVLMTPTLFDNGSIIAFTDTLLRWAQGIDSLAAAKGVSVINTTRFMVALAGDSLEKFINQGNGHPNDYGYFVAAEAMTLALPRGAAHFGGPIYTDLITARQELRLLSQITMINGIIRDSARAPNDTSVSELSTFSPFVGFTHAWMKTNGSGGSFFNIAPKYGNNLAGFETSNTTAPNSYYGPGSAGHGLSLFTDAAGHSYLRLYGGQEDFSQGTDLTLFDNSGNALFVLDQVAGGINFGGWPSYNAAARQNFGGQTVFGTFAAADWIVLKYPNFSNPSNTNYPVVMDGPTNAIRVTAASYSPTSLNDTAAAAPLNDMALHTVQRNAILNQQASAQTASEWITGRVHSGEQESDDTLKVGTAKDHHTGVLTQSVINMGTSTSPVGTAPGSYLNRKVNMLDTLPGVDYAGIGLQQYDADPDDATNTIRMEFMIPMVIAGIADDNTNGFAFGSPGFPYVAGYLGYSGTLLVAEINKDAVLNRISNGVTAPGDSVMSVSGGRIDYYYDPAGSPPTTVRISLSANLGTYFPSASPYSQQKLANIVIMFDKAVTTLIWSGGTAGTPAPLAHANIVPTTVTAGQRVMLEWDDINHVYR